MDEQTDAGIQLANLPFELLPLQGKPSTMILVVAPHLKRATSHQGQHDKELGSLTVLTALPPPALGPNPRRSMGESKREGFHERQVTSRPSVMIVQQRGGSLTAIPPSPASNSCTGLQ